MELHPDTSGISGATFEAEEFASVSAASSHRVFVDTDLGGSDPDDIQSLVRLAHYSDILRVEGIVSTPSGGSPTAVVRIKEWIKRADLNHLRSRGYTALMSESQLLSPIAAGAATPGAPTTSRSTAGSRLIGELANSGDPLGAGRPLWVLVWGPITTVAQALFDDPGIANRIRIYSIGSWNTTQDQASYNWIKTFLRSHRNLWWIDNGDNVQNCDTFRGVYQGGNQTGEWSRTQFIAFNVRGHGSTHNGLYSQKTGDAFPAALWPVNSLKEGDTPSMLYLLAPVLAGNGDVNNPLVDSWGGRFRKYSAATHPNYYVDLATACQVTVSRHRVSFLSDWKARWDRYAP